MEAASETDEIAQDAVVLITGPPLTGKYELMLRLLRQRTNQAIIITTKQSATRVRADFRAQGNDDSSIVGVVDCISRLDLRDGEPGSEWNRYIASPENLTQIGVEFTELSEQLEDHATGGPFGTGIHSATHLLIHTDLKKLNHFMQVLTSQLRALGWFGVITADESALSTEEIRTLETHFDTVVQTRRNEKDKPVFRLRDETAQQPKPWTTI